MKSKASFLVRGTDFSYHAFFIAVSFYERRIAEMPDYKELYFELFNKVTDVIEQLEQIQKDMEDMYVDSSEKNDEEN